jgi:hypothetical protein
MSTRKKITYETDDDSGLITFYIDGVEFDCWSFEDEPEESFAMFMKIYNAGYNEGLEQNVEIDAYIRQSILQERAIAGLKNNLLGIRFELNQVKEADVSDHAFNRIEIALEIAE